MGPRGPVRPRIKAPDAPYDGKVSELTVAEFPEKFGPGTKRTSMSVQHTSVQNNFSGISKGMPRRNISMHVEICFSTRHLSQ